MGSGLCGQEVGKWVIADLEEAHDERRTGKVRVLRNDIADVLGHCSTKSTVAAAPDSCPWTIFQFSDRVDDLLLLLLLLRNFLRDRLRRELELWRRGLGRLGKRRR